MKITGLKAMIYNRLHREELYGRAEYWDTKAAELSGAAVSMWHNDRLNQLYNAELLEVFDCFLPDVRQKLVLDLGCGTGRLSRYLATRGAQVTGIDFSVKAVEIARRESPGGNTMFRVQSMLDMEDVEKFDHAVSWGSITFACSNRYNLHQLMVQLHRALKPGGKVLLMEPIHRGFLHRVLNVSQREFIDVMHTTGFRIDEVVNLHFWPARLALAYVNWPAFITTPAYHLGQWIMRVLFRNRAFGDYTAIIATKDFPVGTILTT